MVFTRAYVYLSYVHVIQVRACKHWFNVTPVATERSCLHSSAQNTRMWRTDGRTEILWQ